MSGLNLYDYLFRNYDPASGRFLTMDPLAEKYYSISPYVYCLNNPIRYVDPTGREIRLAGNATKETFKQLNSSTSLKLSIKDGVISAKGNAKTNADRMLLSAIQDKNVIVGINTTNSNYTEQGNWFVGGAFGGNKVGEDGKTYTDQTINPIMAKNIDNFYDLGNGVTTLHEVLESYIGGVESPGSGVPTFDQNTPEFKAYQNAHNKAKEADPRYKEPILSHDCESCPKYINKYDPNIVPAILNKEILINDLSK